MRVLLILAMLLQTMPSFAQDQGLCANERALKLNANGYSCRVELVPFRWQHSIRQVEMAAVTVGFQWDVDVGYDIQKYLFRLPNDEIMQVDARPMFPAFSTAAQPEFEFFHVPDELLYEYRAFELFSGQLCAVAQLKYPFVGYAKSCEGQSPQSHPLKLVAGVVTPAAVRAKVCSLLNAEVGQCSGLRAVELIRTDRNELIYRLGGRIRLNRTDMDRALAPELSIVYEERTYDVSLDGLASLSSKFGERCTHSQVTRPRKVNNLPQTTCERVVR